MKIVAAKVEMDECGRIVAEVVYEDRRNVKYDSATHGYEHVRKIIDEIVFPRSERQ